MLEMKVNPKRPGQSLQCHVMSSSLIRPLHHAKKRYFGEVNIELIFKKRGLPSCWVADDKKVERIDYHGWRCFAGFKYLELRRAK